MKRTELHKLYNTDSMEEVAQKAHKEKILYQEIISEWSAKMQHILDYYVDPKIRGEGRNFFDIIEEQLQVDILRLSK